jgi:Ca2+-transporting ATPase
MKVLEKPWSLSGDEVLGELESNTAGLKSDEVKRRIGECGPNMLKAKDLVPWYLVFIGQFANPLIYILIAAAALKAYFKGPFDAAVIGIVLLFMAIVGFIQEMKARKAMEALLNLSAPKAKVRRDGVTISIDASQLVPGDILIIDAGDRIAADARLLEAANLKVNEAPFTGESLPVEKNTRETAGDKAIHDRRNMVFMGTTVSSGRAVAIIVATGMNTEIGQIAEAIRSVKRDPTPLQKAIDRLGHSLIWVVTIACSVLFVVGLLHRLPWVDVFMLAIAAAVSGIPEGLPAAVTVVLAIAVNRMSKRNVIIRKMTAVETLGTATVICSDKTGTLTLNQMTVREIWVDRKVHEVTGDGYVPMGEMLTQKSRPSPNDTQSLTEILRTASLCNDAILAKNGDKYEIIGDPTEGALIVAAEKIGLHHDKLKNDCPRLDEMPFESDKQFMATLHIVEGNRLVCVKGSIEKVMAMCSEVRTQNGASALNDERRKEIVDANDAMANKALRVLAIAIAPYPDSMGKLDQEKFTGTLQLIGLIGMIDPPRTEALHAVESCKKAGIRVVMITGDNHLTAAAIATQLGISRMGDSAITGKEIEQMDDATLDETCRTNSVYARIEPLHKLRIVRAFRRLGHVTAMTGDGVNDAPALEASSIGVAMGITGTDVAKEAADMVLSDDNFASIVSAVEEGRIVFNRLRNVAFFLLFTCAAELITILLSVTIYGAAPFQAIQILWINLVTGSLAAIPLGLEPGTGHELRQPPRKQGTGLLYQGMVIRLFLFAAFAAFAVVWIFFHAPIPQDANGAAILEIRQTVAFTAVVLFEWFFVFQCRSTEEGVVKLGIFKNRSLLIAMIAGIGMQMAVIYLPWANSIFHTYPLTISELMWAVFPGICIFILESVRKMAAPDLFSKGQWG